MIDAASSTPDTGAVTTGPTTFSDPSLSWTEDSSASTPSSESTPAVSASADATVPPAATDAPIDGLAPTGEPPKERWDAILANARQKAADEATAPLAWARDVNPQDFQQLQAIAKHFASGDLETGLRNFLSELGKDPQAAAVLKGIHARELAALRGRPPAAPPNQEPQPDLPIQLEDGRVVHLYSAEQQAKREAFLQQQWMQGVEQKLQPLQQTHEQLQAERAAIQREQQVTQFVTTTFADMQTWPGMDDKSTRADVAKAIEAMQLTSDDPREVQLIANAAYRRVVLPKLQAAGQSALLESLKTKAAASTSVNPGSAAATTPKKVTKFSDLGPEAWR